MMQFQQLKPEDFYTCKKDPLSQSAFVDQSSKKLHKSLQKIEELGEEEALSSNVKLVSKSGGDTSEHPIQMDDEFQE